MNIHPQQVILMEEYLKILYPILLLIAIGTAIFLLVKYLNVRKSLILFKKLTETAEKMKKGEVDTKSDFDIYLNVKSGSKTPEFELLQKSAKKLLQELAVGIDNTLRNQQIELENAKILAANSAQTQFFSNMSHEIRTPMNSILGIAQILLHDDNLTEIQIKYLEEIKEASDSLLIIVNDILDLSKLESGNFTIIENDFSLNNMLEHLVGMARYTAGRKKLEFNYEVEGEIPNALYGDETHIHKILSNLLSNALKYTKKGSVNFRVEVQEENIVCEIEDTGVGIADDKTDKIFTPFEDYEPIAGHPDSIGLGLPIVKRLAEIMGAKIDMKSEIGRGSTFTVIFPKVLGDVAKLSDDVSTSEFSAQKAAILIVDDNEINLHVASGLIETFFKVDCDLALSGKEALEKILEKDYDLVFMDLMMPEMDGVETTNAIRNLGAKYSYLPIVALTATSVIGTREELLSFGMNDFLSKPIQKKELYAILRKWLPQDKINVNEGFANNGSEIQANNSLFENLSNVRGFDLRQALRNVANREDILENSLKLLLSKIPGQISELKYLFDAKDLRRFSFLTHTIKGSFSNCGFVLLSKLASKLSKESEVENFAYCRENFSFFIEKLEDVETQLSNIFNLSKNSEEKVKGNSEDLEKIKDKLIDAMDEYNYYAIVDLVEELKKSDYGKEKNETINLLDEKTKFYDYNGAKEFIYSL
jgi:signal transduction histidine kinase/CheY-like chemotaxis protein